jgi:hypothetical protein
LRPSIASQIRRHLAASTDTHTAHGAIRIAVDLGDTKGQPAMSGITQRLLVAATLVLVGVPSGSASAAADVLDQSQPSWAYITRAIGGAPVAQIFTAGTYGILDRVSVVLENYAPNPATSPLQVVIQAVREGLPPGDSIASATIPVSALPPAGLLAGSMSALAARPW